MLTLTATPPTRPATIGSLEWLAALADLDPEEIGEFVAYLEAVARGEAVEWWPDLAPYVLAEECRP